MADLDIDLEEELAAIRAHKAGKESGLVVRRYGDMPLPQDIRQQMQLTQQAFAALMGVSRRTLEGWEQGRRKPQGPALALLRIAAQHPQAFLSRK